LIWITSLNIHYNSWQMLHCGRGKKIALVVGMTVLESCPVSTYLMYVCPCVIYEIDERYPLDATIYLLL